MQLARDKVKEVYLKRVYRRRTDSLLSSLWWQNISNFPFFSCTVQIQGQHDELHTAYTETKEQLQKLQEYSIKLDNEMEKLEALETDENQG